jgi:putative copper export protein/mono/diheme cytochrome c family protein
MKALLLGALWVHLAASVGLVGAFFMLLLAGPARGATARRWDRDIVRFTRVLVLVALVCGGVWLLLRTALFENRPGAALEARAVWHAVLDTWPGLVWLARHSLLLLLAAFLTIPADVGARSEWIAARGQALVLATLALLLTSASSHAAAVTPGTRWAVVSDVTHLLGTGLWAGGLLALGLLLRAAGRETGADALPYAVVATRRFSSVALIVMLALIASGVGGAIVQVESVAGLAGTTHGRLLLAKLAVLIPVLVIAGVNRTRVLPSLTTRPVMRRLAVFVGLEAGLALVMLALAAAMTLTTPARHGDAVWPLPFRISLEALVDAPAARRRAFFGTQLVVLGVVVSIAALVVRRRRAPALAGALALALVGAGVGVWPLVLDAYPTTYRRPPVTYHVTSIASGMAVYRDHCALCHGPGGAQLRGARTSRRHAGELFWLVTHGVAPGMPPFAERLTEPQRWDVINFIRALAAADGSTRLGPDVQLDDAWLIPPDFTVAVGPLAPGALRDHRGRRMVLVVLYTLPGSRARLAELARSYDLLSVLGVEIIAVPTHAPADPLGELGGASPPVLFPVVTDGAADIVATYRMFAPGPHTELLVDRQGYIRAIWRDAPGTLPAQVETLNAEKDVPPFPDDHVH